MAYLEASICSSNIPDIDRTGLLSGPHLLLISHPLFYSLVYNNVYNFTTTKSSPDRKEIPARRANYPVPDPNRSWIPYWTVPQIRQNTALWPNFFRGCMVQSRDPRIPVCPAHLYYSISLNFVTLAAEGIFLFLILGLISKHIMHKNHQSALLHVYPNSSSDSLSVLLLASGSSSSWSLGVS